jgi:hypothetical protein
MRELQPWADRAAVDASFADISGAGGSVPFRRLRPRRRTGCAVLDALGVGRLDRRSFENYRRAGARGGVRGTQAQQGCRLRGEAPVEADHQAQRTLYRNRDRG